jgi:hypothetical protein
MGAMKHPTEVDDRSTGRRPRDGESRDGRGGIRPVPADVPNVPDGWQAFKSADDGDDAIAWDGVADELDERGGRR